MNFQKIVNSMREKNDIVDLQKYTILEQCIFCKKYLFSNKWSIVLENIIK